MSYLSGVPVDWLIAVGGAPYNALNIAKFGYAEDCDLNDKTFIWDGAYSGSPDKLKEALIETAEIVDIASDDANDTAAGTGLQAVRVVGIGADNKWAEDDVELNGLTLVSTTKTFRYVFRAYGTRFGSNNENIGNIRLDGQTTGFLLGRIGVGNGQTLQAGFCVPQGRVFLLKNYYASILRTTTAVADIELRTFDINEGGWRTRHRNVASRESGLDRHFDSGIVVSELNIIRMFATSNSNNVAIGAGFGGFLLDAP